MKTIDEQIDRILTKLEQVRRRGLKCFGSGTHGFRLAPPMAEATVSGFESQHGIRLPANYRRFLLEAGGSGAGPYYGILPLDDWNCAAVTDSGEIPEDYLARPCPLFPGMPESNDWREKLGASYDEQFQGTIAVSNQGCSFYCLLIVSGQARGRVVYVNTDGGLPYFVWDADFLSWYERWLDELLWGYDDFWFGFGLPGREDDLVAVLLNANSSPDVRSEALKTLLRIPSLSDNTLALARGLLRDSSADVRCIALSVLGKHVTETSTAEIRALLQDANALVRRVALEALKNLPPSAWESAARSALRDPDHDVVFFALCRLKDAGLLVKGDVVPLSYSSDPKIRSDATWASVAIIDEDSPLPEELLARPGSQSASVRDTGPRRCGGPPKGSKAHWDVATRVTLRLDRLSYPCPGEVE